jgi:hypothetical protein
MPAVSELAQAFIARQRYLQGENGEEQFNNYRSACDLAEGAIRKATAEAPDLLRVTEEKPAGYAFDNWHVVSNFFAHNKSGLHVATRQRLRSNPLYEGTIEPAEGVEGIDVLGYDLMIAQANFVDDLAVPYAKVSPYRRAIDHTLGDGVVHARGYNAEADLEVVEFFGAVHTGIHRAAQ